MELTQSLYRLDNFDLVCTEEIVNLENDIYLMKKDVNGNITEYYANITDTTLSMMRDNHKLYDAAKYLKENQYVEGLVSFETDKTTVDSIYSIFSPVNVKFTKSFVRSNIDENYPLFNKSSYVGSKFDSNLEFVRNYYRVNTKTDDKQELESFISELNSLMGKDVRSQILSKVSIDEIYYLIYSKKNNEDFIYISKMN